MALETTPARFFSKVKEARELLKGKSVELYEMYMRIIQKAEEAGEHETAMKHIQWLIDHMPAEDGERMVEGSIDKQKEIAAPVDSRPRVQIGIQLGGVNAAKPEGTGKALPQVTVTRIDHD